MLVNLDATAIALLMVVRGQKQAGITGNATPTGKLAPLRPCGEHCPLPSLWARHSQQQQQAMLKHEAQLLDSELRTVGS